MFNADLAKLYGVSTKALNQAMNRNKARFPEDFAFRLSQAEFKDMRSQIVTSSFHGGRRRPPYAFTEQGVAMLSSVLRSARAVEVNIAIMRTFVQLRRLMDSNRNLARKIEALSIQHNKQHGVRGRRWVDCIGRLVSRPSDWEIASQFAVVFDAIKQLIAPPAPAKKQIGFHP